MTRKKQKNRYQTDHYAQQAKKDHFPARSVYKLKEIQQKFNLMAKGDQVLDLGCAPGSWAKYAASVVGPEGWVVGVDLKDVTEKFPANTRIMIGDVLALAEMEKENLEQKIGSGYNIVLSDMAPATTGRKEVDAARRWTPPGLIICAWRPLPSHKKVWPQGARLYARSFRGRTLKYLKMR